MGTNARGRAFTSDVTIANRHPVGADYVRHFTVITSELNARCEWYLFASASGALRRIPFDVRARVYKRTHILTPVLMRLKSETLPVCVDISKSAVRSLGLENVEMRLNLIFRHLINNPVENSFRWYAALRKHFCHIYKHKVCIPCCKYIIH